MVFFADRKARLAALASVPERIGSKPQGKPRKRSQTNPHSSVVGTGGPGAKKAKISLADMFRGCENPNDMEEDIPVDLPGYAFIPPPVLGQSVGPSYHQRHAGTEGVASESSLP